MVIATIILAFLTIAGFLRFFWWFSAIDYFRLQYASMALIVALWAVFNDAYLISLINTGLCAANIYRIKGFLPEFTPTASYKDKTILSVNAYKKNFNPEKFHDFIFEANPDVMLIMEMTDELHKEINDKLTDYPHKLTSPVRDGFNICLYSKNPLEDQHVNNYGDTNTPLLSAKCRIKNKEFQIFSAHPKPALNKKWFSERQKYFDKIQEEIKKSNLPVLMLGDFNSVPWENHFTDFLKNTSLKSVIQGNGYKITWPSLFPLAGVPMDHILISEEIAYKNLSIKPYIGSDHFPIAIDL